jgi:transposase-like protein
MTTHTIPPGGQKSLSERQRKAALLLASGSTIANAAREVGVNEKSVDNWLRTCAFQEAKRQAEDDLYNESLTLLKKSMRLAIGCLLRNMSEKVSPYVQVQAASKLLDAALEVGKIEQLEARIAELEEMVRYE